MADLLPPGDLAAIEALVNTRVDTSGLLRFNGVQIHGVVYVEETQLRAVVEKALAINAPFRLAAPKLLSHITAQAEEIAGAKNALYLTDKLKESLLDELGVMQSTLWRVLKDHRDWTDQAAINARNDLDEAVKNGWNIHLPTIEEVRAQGPYFRIEDGETYEQAEARAALSSASPSERPLSEGTE